jgi:hypothetical protein
MPTFVIYAFLHQVLKSLCFSTSSLEELLILSLESGWKKKITMPEVIPSTS